jgi:hypothetical protein
MGPESLSQMSKITAAEVAESQEAIKETLEASQTLELLQEEAVQDEMSPAALRDEMEGNFTAAGIAKRTTKLEPRSEVKKSEKAKQVEESVLVRKDADDLADQFSRRQGNREYHLDPKVLSQLAVEELGAGITERSTLDEVIQLIRRRMSVGGQPPDVAIVDKAFEFLLEATRMLLGKTSNEKEQKRLSGIINILENAKNKHFKEQNHAITDHKGNEVVVNDITTAHHIIGAVDEVAKATGKTVKETLDYCRNVVHNPSPEEQMRLMLHTPDGKTYKLYKDLVAELKALNAYVGGDLRKPSQHMEHPEMHQLITAAKMAQTALSPFRLTKAKIPTAESYLKLNHVLTAAAA